MTRNGVHGVDLETIRDVVDDRCFMIANILNVETMDQDAVAPEENQSLFGDSIGNFHPISTPLEEDELLM